MKSFLVRCCLPDEGAGEFMGRLVTPPLSHSGFVTRALVLMA